MKIKYIKIMKVRGGTHFDSSLLTICFQKARVITHIIIAISY